MTRATVTLAAHAGRLDQVVEREPDAALALGDDRVPDEREGQRVHLAADDLLEQPDAPLRRRGDLVEQRGEADSASRMRSKRNSSSSTSSMTPGLLGGREQHVVAARLERVDEIPRGRPALRHGLADDAERARADLALQQLLGQALARLRGRRRVGQPATQPRLRGEQAGDRVQLVGQAGQAVGRRRTGPGRTRPGPARSPAPRGSRPASRLATCRGVRLPRRRAPRARR